MAGKVLNSYPDYAKATPGYTAGIMEAFAAFPPEIQAVLADLKTGLRARCSFLPTIADVMKLGDELQAKANERAAFESKYSGVVRQQTGYVRTTAPCFTMFPQLTAAFRDNPECLEGNSFDRLADAARALAVQGKAAAEAVLGIESKMSAA